MITLLTDFGDLDVYVGVLKGVIAQINPAAAVVDLTHKILPQNIGQGSFQLGNAYAHFPSGTVHLAVVDPGVGGQRRAIALQTASAFFVGPDNGLFSAVLNQNTEDQSETSPLAREPCPSLAAVELSNPQYWYTPKTSSTFHGRDIFAAAAAHLTLGCPLDCLGQRIKAESLVRLPQSRYRLTPERAFGAIQAIDHFGNLITNIPAVCLGDRPWHLEAATQLIASAGSYSASNPDRLLALVGSHGWLEIALQNGNAQQRLQLTVGSPVQLIFLA
ncbi:MAG: SAM-dependent chlorinase/fluorinase [Acaryochloridaceae cyanobacterium SU_2_1]|nr:SAM-dependent chlorinase/fluorinase [Acaryochloridaceae cyanobacterium SU_2_1]